MTWKVDLEQAEHHFAVAPQAGDDVSFGFWQYFFFSLFASAQTNEHSLVAFDEAPAGRGYFGPGPLPL